MGVFGRFLVPASLGAPQAVLRQCPAPLGHELAPPRKARLRSHLFLLDREARTAEFIEKKGTRTSEAEKGMRCSDDDAVFLGELEEGGDGVQFALRGDERPPPAQIPLKTNPDLEKESFIV